MNVLVIGSGGREHAIAWKLAQSPLVETVYVAPGNAGTSLEPGVVNVHYETNEHDQLLQFAKDNVQFTIVGPEDPLVDGIVDLFNENRLLCLGPTRKAAQLEGSKIFAKEFLDRYLIPTASYNVYEEAGPAIEWIKNNPATWVIKADGLAAGKGVTVASTEEEAIDAINEWIPKGKIIIEECLVGEEASFICLIDGEYALPLATSQDHKARDANDEGPNTGGMGAYSPAPVITDTVHRRIMREIVHRTMHGFKKEGIVYKGFLYVGLMIDEKGSPKVLEYNCRLGDPETQPILMRLETALADLCLAALAGKLKGYPIRWDKRPALGVVMASEGYPGEYKKGDPISGLNNMVFRTVSRKGPIGSKDIKVFHAGTVEIDGNVCTDGGRILCVTALGESIGPAQNTAYEGVKQIHWPGAFHRPDIGNKAFKFI